MALEAGADAVGFIIEVSQSPRNLSIPEAKKLINLTPIFTETVAVTVPKNINQLYTMYQELRPSIIQVHGLNQQYREIREKIPNARIIRAIHANLDFTTKTAIETTDNYDAILLDSYVPDKFGGTGLTHDWRISKKVRDTIYPKPLILAGGLKPENVKKAISLVKPYAVDVSSGVELSPGEKDSKKIFRIQSKRHIG